MTKREKIAQAVEDYRHGKSESLKDTIDCILAAEDDPPEPEIKPGEWVYYGDKLPLDHCRVGKLYRTSFPDHAPYCIEGVGRFSYVERFSMPFDWERWPDVKWVVDFDSTARIVLDSDRCPWELEDRNRFGARVVRILKRPEGR